MFYNTERIDKRQYLLIKNEDRQTTDKRTDIQTFNQVFFFIFACDFITIFHFAYITYPFPLFFCVCSSIHFLPKVLSFFSFSPSFCHVLSSKESSSHSFSPSRTYYTRSRYLFLSLSFTLLLSLSLSLSCSPLSMRIINRVSLHRYHRYLTRRFLSRFKSDVSPETLPSSRGFLIIVVYSPQSLPLTSLYLFFSCSSFLLSRTKSRVERLSKLTILGKEQR